MLTERELTVLRVALLGNMSRLLQEIPDHGDLTVVPLAFIIERAEMHDERRDLYIKLGKMRDKFMEQKREHYRIGA